MRKITRSVSVNIYDADLATVVHIMQTDSGWWTNLEQLVRVVEGIASREKLVDVWEYAGITKKQWRHFIDVHLDFDHWRRARKSKSIPIGRMPEFIFPDRTEKIELRAPEEVVAVSDDVKVEIIDFAGLLTTRRRKPVHIPSGEVILLPASPTEPEHYAIVEDSTQVRDSVMIKLVPDMSPAAIDLSLQKETGREAQRERTAHLWKLEHQRNPLVRDGSVWIVTRAGDK